jgi:hypothetical protein
MASDAGVKALRKIQMGAESSAGTIEAPTTIWRGMGTIEDTREIVFVEEDIGYISGVDRTYTPRLAAALSFEDVEATYEQMPHVLDASFIKATPTQDGSGSGYIYQYDVPVTSQWSDQIQTYTFIGGDDADQDVMEYSFVEAFTLSGVYGEAWMVSAEWLGRQVQQTSGFQSGVALPSVSEILFSKTRIYADDVSGTAGATELSQTLLEATLEVTTGLVAKETADGKLYFSYPKSLMPEITLECVMEHDSNAVAEKQNFRNEKPRLLRLEAKGDTLSTAGSTYTEKTMIIDLAGKWESFGPLDDDDGNDTITGTFRVRYNETAALFAKFIFVNELASLP